MSTDKKNEVNSFWLDQDLTKNYTLGWYAYGFSINTSIHPEQFDKVKKAILSALNDTVEDSKIKELESLLEYYQAEFNANQDKVYTQAEVDAIRADTWKAARKATPLYDQIKYEYFDLPEYLSSINTNEEELRGSLNISNNQEHVNDTGNANFWESVKLPESAPEPSALPTKEYEIVSFKRNATGSVFPTSDVVNINEYIPSNDYSIHSVRRLKDSEVFQIGDKIGWGIHDSYETTLTGFEIVEGRLKFNDSERPAHCKWADFLNAVNLHKK